LIRYIVAAVLCLVTSIAVLAVAHPAGAQQQEPDLVNPSGSVQSEEQMLRELQRIQGRGSFPDVKSNVIQQPAGRGWSNFHEVYLRWIGGIAIVGIFCMVAAFYLWRGSVEFGARAGRTIPRFNAFERFVHWMTAVSFIVLAVSGLNITFGKQLLLPLIGPSAFSTWSQAAKYAHNYFSFPFTIGVILMFPLWVASNLPERVDIEWIKKGGGMLGGEHPPCGKFNIGEKMIFWLVIFAGGLVAVTGYILLFPFYGTEIRGMQLAQIVHAVAGVLYIAAMLVHIYMGSIGLKGAFESMVSGDVDVNWAKSHHSLWYDEVVNAGSKDQPKA
jgi:formate dehydrogenase subunit gamma